MSDFLSSLACPRDQEPLTLDGRELSCAVGHVYPVVDGIPVLLVEDDAPTIGIARASLECARRTVEGNAPDDPWYSSTLGISETERASLLALAARGDVAIDPVAKYLVAATNGILYRDLVGSLRDYPIPELRLPVGAGRTLLDIGCSWGRWSIAAARKGYRVVGIDPSLGAVLAARRIARSLDLVADFAVGDARRLPFFSRQFDNVFSYSVLQHFGRADVRLSLREVGRVLQPGGRSLVQMANCYGLRCLYHQARRGFRAGRGFEVRYWSPRALRHAFAEAVGESRVTVDCFFGIGLQASDSELMSSGRQRVLRASEWLRHASATQPWMRQVADSLYIESSRRASPESPP